MAAIISSVTKVALAAAFLPVLLQGGSIAAPPVVTPSDLEAKAAALVRETMIIG
jgi:hypothetical protein